MLKPRSAISLGTLFLAGGFSAAPPAHAATWLENVSVLVDVGGKPDGSARVYDSDDFQRMLLVLEDRPTAFLLDLGATSVLGIPRDSIRVSAEGTVEIGEAPGEMMTTLDQRDGTLYFIQDDSIVSIQPLPPLIGAATLERILELKPSYAVAAQRYKPDPVKIAALKTVQADTEIRVFFGTWCLMCKRLLPGFIRTIELAANPKIRVSYTGVDEDEKEPEAEIRANSVSTTPTLIVIQSGRQIGRIEEKASTTIEADLVSILSPKR